MPKKVDYTALFILLFATCLGGFIRFSLAARGDFPINDGGMFYTMVSELINQRLALPETTAYNGHAIPFFYPPLSFYLAAILFKLVHVPLLTLLQYLPAALSTLTIPAFFKLSLTFTESPAQAAFTALAFCFLPRSYEWLIMGGGLSRALGFFFAILAFERIIRLFKLRTPQYLVGAVLFSALTILSHPEVSWFLFCGAALVGIWFGRDRAGIRHASLVMAGTLLLISPWLVSVIAQHGTAPLLAAFQVRNDSSFPLVQLLLFTYTDEAFTDIIGALAFFGLFNELFRKRFFLPAWVALTVFLALRNAPYILMLPVALLAGIGLDQVVLPGITRKPSPVKATLKDWLETKPGAIFCTVLLVYLLFSAISFSFLTKPSLRSLPAGEREAMAWVAGNTPPASKFLLLTAATSWEIDRASEWFPALTGRTSLATVQGTEWLAGEVYTKTQESYRLLQACASQEVGCLRLWEEGTGQAFTHIYLSKAPPGESDPLLNLRQELTASPDYELIYDGVGAAVFAAR